LFAQPPAAPPSKKSPKNRQSHRDAPDKIQDKKSAAIKILRDIQQQKLFDS
jgi:hypothetical protein